jgi:hypothetical protein
MSSRPSNTRQSFLPTSLIIPEISDEKEFNYILTDFIKRIVVATNSKDIAQYPLEEIQNGQEFFDPEKPTVPRGAYRKVIDFGALPNATTKDVQHGIKITEATRFTRIYGTANHPSVSFIPLPFASAVANVPISVEVTSTVVRVTTAIDYSAYTDTFIVLEYLKA